MARVSPAIQTLQPDAIHLDFTAIYDDGNGPIEGKNYKQGLAQLQSDLLAAFPNLVLGAEETSDDIAGSRELCAAPLLVVLELSFNARHLRWRPLRTRYPTSIDIGTWESRTPTNRDSSRT